MLVLGGHALAGPVAASGVTLFFGLSGYLITGILMKERARSGRLNLRRFYWRRLTRLAPPMLLVVGVTAVLLRGLPWDSWLFPVTWTSNYARLADLPVYPFGHTWSLAVEEQFYIVWPVAFLLLMSRRRPVLWLGAALAVLMAWRLILLVAGQFSYQYLAFETASTTILVGCLVAIGGWRVSNQLVVLAAIVGLVLLPVAMKLASPTGWYWLPLLTTPLVGVILAGSAACSWLTWRWLGFLGVASYSLYLWHEPVAFMLVGEDVMSPQGVAAGVAAGLVAYFVLERPLMRWRERQQNAAHRDAADYISAPVRG